MSSFASMFPGSLVISRPDWIWPAVALLALALFGVVWGYRRSSASRGVRFACALLKTFGLLALTACLLEPLWVGRRARPGANFIAVLADNSQSLGLRDSGQPRSRGEQLKEMLTDPGSDWRAGLQEEFQVRRFMFDGRLEGVRDFSELTFDGHASALNGALRSVSERLQGQPLAGVLLFTDGNATDLKDGRVDIDSLPPVYPVVLGQDRGARDLSIQAANVSQTSFDDTPVTVQTDVAAHGFAGARLRLRLVGMDGKTVEEDTRRVSGDEERLRFRFQLKPEKSGVSFYRLEVSGDEKEGNPSASDQEATLVNNRRLIVVDRGEGPRRILYVGGRPNWEFKFLNRALSEDDRLQLTALIRIARREPKFEFRGRSGESSNPLFRGFDQKTEETERYDQPVLVRLNTKDAAELAGGFPKTPEDLYQWHAVVLDDVEAAFFTHEQLAHLQQFVSERGGGFLMLGGIDTFQAGHYERTPVGEMLPVYLDRQVEHAPAGDLRLSLTREGWLQPWVRLRPNEADERERLDLLPALEVLSATRDIKPGAMTLATVTDDQKHVFPAFVAQRFGNGRVGALLVGDLWRSGLRQPDQQADLARAWRQTMRWLVTDVPDPVELTSALTTGPGGPLRQLEVKARDRKFQPLDNATVALTVRQVFAQTNAAVTNVSASSSTNGLHLNPEPSTAEPGSYEAGFVAREPGAYLAEAVVTDSQGAEAGRARTGWTADPAAEEFVSLVPNRAVLSDLARRTGGQLLTASDLPGFVARLPRRHAPIMESWSYPLWHQPLLFALALLCFAGEWGLRRWKGLA